MPTRLVYVFSPRGGQTVGWGQALHRGEPVYRESIARSSRQIQQLQGWSLEEEMFRPPAEYRLLLDELLLAPALTAHQIALSDLLAAYGVQPDAVLAMAEGEIAAAHVAGAISAPDAIRIACAGSHLLGDEPGAGRHVVVYAPLAEIERMLPSGVAVTAELNDRMTVIGGTASAALPALKRLVRAGVPHQIFHTRATFESLDRGRAEFFRALSEPPLESRLDHRPFYAASVGGPFAGRLDAAHWWRSVRERMRNADAVRRILQDGYQVFVDLGHEFHQAGTVRTMAEAAGVQVQTMPSMRADLDSDVAFAALVRRLGALGIGGADAARDR